MQLADNNAFGTVYDECAAFSHTGQIDQEDFLFFDFTGLLHDQLNTDVEWNRIGQIALAALIGAVLDAKRNFADERDFAFFFDKAAIVIKALFAQLQLRTILTHRQTEAVIIVFEAEITHVVLDRKNFSENFFQPLFISFRRFSSGLQKPFERFELDVDEVRNVFK